MPATGLRDDAGVMLGMGLTCSDLVGTSNMRKHTDRIVTRRP